MQYTLSTFQVRLADIDNEPIWFTCQAEDKEHAQEQAENAYPGYVLVSVKRLPQIKAGSTVWWTDPDNGSSSGRYQVLKVLTENGTVEHEDDLIFLVNEAGSQVEALAHEISSPPSIEELAIQLLNSESDEGCEGGYTVVNQRLLLNLIYEIQHTALQAKTMADARAEISARNLHGNVAEAKPSRAVSLSETTLTFSLPDDFGAGWEYVNQRLHGASHAWAGSYDKSESANFAHEALMQVQGVDSSYLATGMTCNVSFVVNDIAEAVAIQSRLQAVVDAFESKPERSISVRGSNFYDSKVTEYDANDPDVEIVSDMPYLNYLAKYVPLAEALPALSGHDLAALRAEADEHQLAKQVDKDDSPSPGM